MGGLGGAAGEFEGLGAQEQQRGQQGGVFVARGHGNGAVDQRQRAGAIAANNDPEIGELIRGLLGDNILGSGFSFHITF